MASRRTCAIAFWLFFSRADAVYTSQERTNLAYIRGPPSPTLSIDHPSMTVGHPPDAIKPEQVHLGLGNGREIVVSWVYQGEDADGTTKVYYGNKPGAYTSKKEADRVSMYTCNVDPCQGYVSGRIMHAKLDDQSVLQTGRKVYYVIGRPGTKHASKEFGFLVPPYPGEPVPLTISIVGDLGQTNNSLATLDHMDRDEADIALIVGDLSYADGNQTRWDSWSRMLEPLASKVPWITIEGNHEIEIGVGDSWFVSYQTRFWSPKKDEPQSSASFNPPYDQWEVLVDPPEFGENAGLFHSYTVGPVKFIMLGTYASYNGSSSQQRWLAKELETVDRQATPWVIVGMHAPFYNTNFAHQMEAFAMKVYLEDLLYNSGVDIVFAGHVHAYERMHRVYKERREPCAPVYITIGDGGNREGLQAGYYWPQPEWSAFREASYGHGRLEVKNTTHALWEWIRNDDGDAHSADRSWVIRRAECTVPFPKSKSTAAS